MDLEGPLGIKPTAPAFDLDAALVERVRKGDLEIPPYPAIALRLAALVRTADFGLGDVVSAISSDQALAAAVIRCASSALYARNTAAVTSLQQAVALIGAKEVVSIVLAATLAATTRSPGSLQPLKRQAWQAAVASALVCQELARPRSVPPGDAFLCGLLHDFGWMVGITCLEEVLAQHPEVPPLPAEQLNGLAQRLHVELGLVVVAQWKMADLFADVISLHHEDSPAQGPFAPLVEVVALSDRIVALLSLHTSVSAEALAAVPGLTPREAAALELVLPHIPEMIASFEGEPGLRQVPSKVAAPAPLPEGFRPIQQQCRIVQPPKRPTCAVVGIASSTFLMESSRSLTPSQLIEAELSTEPTPLRLWAKVTRCSAHGKDFDIECKPFALNGAAQRQWNSLFRAAE